ncbi:MAG: glycosyltransferase family 4 protein [Actinomycetota bacterium]|nr:glycosyltransferase family 4 protein [Actinomycetota bacterium]
MLSISLITLGDPATLTGGYLYHRRMADAAPSHDARITFTSFPNLAFPLPAIAGRRIVDAVGDSGADVVVLDSIAAAYLAPWLGREKLGVPLVGSLHQPPGGIDHGPLRTAIQARLDRMAYRHAALLLVASDLLAEQLLEDGVPLDRLRVVPPGRDVAGGGRDLGAGPGPRDRADLRQGRSAAFLCVGNWVERKGILSLLDAVALLPEGAATLHLVGDDTADSRYASRVRDRLADPALRDRVVVHGPLSREEVAALYRGADAFVLPSLKEPYGTVYGEAMAEGLPVVGWRAGNLPYLAEHEREGLLMDPGDVSGLASSLALLALDEPMRRRMGKAARDRAVGRPTWEESAAVFFGSIREVAARLSRS